MNYEYASFIDLFNQMSEEQFQEFTSKRLEFLEETHLKEEQDESFNLQRIYKGYINSETPIV